MVEEFRWRRDYVLERFRRLDGVTAFGRRAPLRLPGRDGVCSPRVADVRSATQAGVRSSCSRKPRALVAGDDFAAPHHIRMSYATSRDNPSRGFDAIERALACC